MPDTKITALTAIGANPIIPATFPIPMVDLTDTSMAASGTTKKVTVNQILGAGGTATLASATITGDLTVDTSTLKVNSSANRVGILTASPESELDVRGLIAVRGTPTFPSTGVGLEAYYSSVNTSTFLQSYDRGGSAFANLTYNALSHIFHLSSGTAMTLNSTGLGVGVTPAAGDGSGVFKAAGTGSLATNTRVGLDVRELVSGNNAGIILGAMTTENTGVIGSRTASGNIAFQTFNGASWGERMRIDYLGNVGVGVTPNDRLTILSDNYLSFQTAVTTQNSGRVARIGTVSVGTGNGYLIFETYKGGSGGGERMRIDSDGNVIITSPTTPATLGTNGQLTVNATSNTNLRFSYRGSDGTTRVANITLA
jgi:hypothetical protein